MMTQLVPASTKPKPQKIEQGYLAWQVIYYFSVESSRLLAAARVE